MRGLTYIEKHKLEKLVVCPSNPNNLFDIYNFIDTLLENAHEAIYRGAYKEGYEEGYDDGRHS